MVTGAVHGQRSVVNSLDTITPILHHCSTTALKHELTKKGTKSTKKRNGVWVLFCTMHHEPCTLNPLLYCQRKCGYAGIDGLGYFPVAGMNEGKMFLQMLHGLPEGEELRPDPLVEKVKRHFSAGDT